MSRLINQRVMHRSMCPIFVDRALAQHPYRQVDLAPDRESSVTCFLLIYSTVRPAIKVERINAHQDTDPRWYDWPGRLRHIIRLWHLIKSELSRRNLSSREIHTGQAVLIFARVCPLVEGSLFELIASVTLASVLGCNTE